MDPKLWNWGLWGYILEQDQHKPASRLSQMVRPATRSSEWPCQWATAMRTSEHALSRAWARPPLTSLETPESKRTLLFLDPRGQECRWLWALPASARGGRTRFGRQQTQQERAKGKLCPAGSQLGAHQLRAGLWHHDSCGNTSTANPW